MERKSMACARTDKLLVTAAEAAQLQRVRRVLEGLPE